MVFSHHCFRHLLSLAVLTALSACNDGVGGVAVGDDVNDDLRLAEVPALKHLAEALEDDVTIGDVIWIGDGINFNTAPNPSALLNDINRFDDDRDRAGREPLSVLTFNVALLDAAAFGFIPIVASPALQERHRVLPGLVFETGADVIVVQELWLDSDVAVFRNRAGRLGYTAFVHDRKDSNDGLAVFVRSDVIAGGTTTAIDFNAYSSRASIEGFPGINVARGWMSVQFVHATIGPVTVFNTHMQSFPEHWLDRVKQARELGIAMRASKQDRDAFFVVGGDFNSGPYYKTATWTSPNGTTEDRWFHNAIAWPVLLTYGDLVDAAIMGRHHDDALADIAQGDTVTNDADVALDVAGAEQGWCERTPVTTFTATDCNSLYFKQYGGTEAPARIDHIFVNDDNGRVIVDGSRLAFTDKQLFGDLLIEPSDHFGVIVDLLVAPR